MLNIFFYAISAFCLWILLSAILINFYFSQKHQVQIEKRSVVETGSMLGFFILMIALVYFKIGSLKTGINLASVLAAIGTILIASGTLINIKGRLNLKQNWGNQIKIYEDHCLIQKGIYKYIRHPLYSSTILMIYGFSLLFINYLVFIANTIIFIPFMIYRARQEDRLLSQYFKEQFDDYQTNTGLFLPKIKKRSLK